jgi:hypothetical protein
MTFSPFRALARSRSLKACPLGVIAAVVMLAPANAENVGGRSNHCARYGDDFVAVAGTDSCVRLGGHVRVDIAKGPQAPMGYAATDGVQRAAERSSQIGPVAPFGLNDLFPR